MSSIQPGTGRALSGGSRLREGGGAVGAYGRNAVLLSAGIGVAGMLTYAYFALASHTLAPDEYGEIVITWSAVFLLVVTLYRPIEQLLSKTIAERDALGRGARDAMRIAGIIQLAMAAAFACCAILLRGPIEDDLLGGNATLYWVFVVTVLLFGASYFARGVLAGHRRFRAYALLVLIESVARVGFVATVAIGAASGQSFVALGMVAAPLAGLLVVPFLLRAGTSARSAPPPGREDTGTSSAGFTVAQGGAFATAVLVIMLSEQILLNAGPLLLGATEGAAAAGFIFNVLMLARAPLVLFQAVAASLLPHLTRLVTRGGERDHSAFVASIRVTLMVVAGFALTVALVVLVAGPGLMQTAFGDNFEYDRAGLLIVAAGMGVYLSAVTLNQVALAQGQARRAAACWIGCAGLFVAWNLLGPLAPDRTVEVGFTGGAVVLLSLLALICRRPVPVAEDIIGSGSPQEVEAQLAAADEAG